MQIYISFNDGHFEWREITSWVIQSNCLVLTSSEAQTRSGRPVGNLSYIPLYNIKEFVPNTEVKANRYIS